MDNRLLEWSSSSGVIIAPNGEHLTLTVIEVGAGRTKLGIEGPKTFQIDRKEIEERKRKR